jgi:F0F1-type ATP synthase assembly protein I
MQCPCDRAFRVKDELAGKKIRCPACKQILLVPAPEIEIFVEDDAAHYLMAEEPKAKKPVAARADEDEEERDERVTAKPAAWVKPAPRREEEEDERPRRRRDEDDEVRPRRKNKIPRRERDEGSGFPAIAISPAIISGVLMMVGAVVWFVLGIVLIDRIFFYPPILFILGIGAVWRGATGQED